MKFKILLFGTTGMLGNCAYKNLTIFNNNVKVIGLVRSKKDLLKFIQTKNQRIEVFNDFKNLDKLKKLVNLHKPNVILNCLGLIKHRPKIQNDDLIFFNSIFPRTLEIICKNRTKIINVSTDCVFSGKKGNYVENSIDFATDLYGVTKYLGEISSYNNLTIRTSIIGHEIKNHLSLLEWLIRNKNKKIPGFTNAYFSGLTTFELIKIISLIIRKNFYLKGVYHISSSRISKYELLKKINQKYLLNKNILAKNNKFIDRSLNSNKFKKETGIKVSNWNKMINEMKNDYT